MNLKNAFLSLYNYISPTIIGEVNEYINLCESGVDISILSLSLPRRGITFVEN